MVENFLGNLANWGAAPQSFRDNIVLWSATILFVVIWRYIDFPETAEFNWIRRGLPWLLILATTMMTISA